MYWWALIMAVLANVAANAAFKLAMAGPGVRRDAPMLNTLGNGWLWAGAAAALLLVASYLYCLRGVPVTLVYPIVTGTSMVGLAVVGAVWLREPVTWQTATGIALVAAGTAFLASHGGTS